MHAAMVADQRESTSLFAAFAMVSGLVLVGRMIRQRRTGRRREPGISNETPATLA
jgi:hypothetical protein